MGFPPRLCLKKKDWHPIYQHYMHSGQRHTALYFNGTRIPWDKAWKEIRRSGAREHDDDHIFGLPDDVVMRSPSPGLVYRAAVTSCGLPIPWHLGDISIVNLSPTAMVHRLMLYEIPSNLLRVKISNIFQQFPTTACVESNNQVICGHHSQLNMSDSGVIDSTLINQSSSLFNQSPEDLDINSSTDELSGALYRLANNMSSLYPGMPLDESWEIIINKTPRYVLLKVLENESDSPTIKAAIDKLARAFGDLDRKDDFLSLIKARCRLYPNWDFAGEYFVFAGRLGCVDSCRLLLNRRPRNPYYYIEAVLDSIAKSNIDCAKIIFRHIFESSTGLSKEKDISYEIFWRFIFAAAKGSYELGRGKFVPFGRQNPAVLHMMEWFLEVGVNVDLPAGFRSLPPRRFSTRYMTATCRSLGFNPVKSSKSLQHALTPSNWMPTALDYLYSENLELYSYLVDHSSEFKTDVTRSGIRRYASQGIDTLRTYLLSRLAHTPAEQDVLLEICLSEEIIRSEMNEYIDFDVISTLLDYNIGLEKFHLKLSASAMLYYTIKAASQQGMHPAVYHIVQTLIPRGAVISAETIDEAVEVEGTTLLQLLSSYGADIKNQGAIALCTALKLDNYRAVNLLLKIGVDVNATLWDHGQKKQMTILAYANMEMSERITPASNLNIRMNEFETPPLIRCKMLQYLISRNVQLRAHPGDDDVRRLLYLILRHGLRNDWEDTVNKTKVLLDAEPLTSDQPKTAPCLLETCFYLRYSVTHLERLSLMYYLIDHGISVSHTGVLAKLILDGDAAENNIRKLLNRGVDINAYCGENLDGAEKYTPLQAAAFIGSLHLVRLLVERGADVNRPAKGKDGRTALQAACELEGSRAIDLVKFLIAHGADVHAPPASFGGVTAFQAAAMDGNFELVLLLLDNGADINAPPSKHGFCALDGSAWTGRLDMVQFLLSLGAVSYQGGESGYRNAIRSAGRNGHLQIADMIRQHALKNEKSGDELFAHWEQWADYASESSDYLDDTDELDDADEVGDTWFENDDFWEDWLPL